MTTIIEDEQSPLGRDADPVAFDVDSHEMTPTHLWEKVFGEAAAEIADIALPLHRAGGNSMFDPSVMEDNAAIDGYTVWQSRGMTAPGAFDFSRRPEVLDAMRLRRQLVFPTFGLYALVLMSPPSGMHEAMDLGDRSATRLYELGRAGLEEYNEWAIRVAARAPDRLRPVVLLPPVSTVDALIDSARGYIDRGIRAIHISVNEPLAGFSPAHPELDPFWALIAERNVALLTHLVAEQGFTSSFAWADAPAFGSGSIAGEVGLSAFFFSTLHYAYANFLSAMVLGGVFERHPRLRFGVIEAGASWFGPMAEELDYLATTPFARQVEPYISMRPSEYLSRNVRVTPFCKFEAVDQMFTRYPQVADCFAYSTDYPHIEGERDSKQKMVDLLAPLSAEIKEKFFVTNGQLLLPD